MSKVFLPGLKELRQNKGLSQPDLRTETGNKVSVDTISKAENGVSISRVKAALLANALEENLSDIAVEDEE